MNSHTHAHISSIHRLISHMGQKLYNFYTFVLLPHVVMLQIATVYLKSKKTADLRTQVDIDGNDKLRETVACHCCRILNSVFLSVA